MHPLLFYSLITASPSHHTSPLCLVLSPVAHRMQRYDIPKLLRSGGGLVRIPNFLPEHIADAILKMLESRPESDWVMTEAR